MRRLADDEVRSDACLQHASIKSSTCVYRKSDSAILVMKTTEDGRDVIAPTRSIARWNGAIFVERAMNSRLIIISSIKASTYQRPYCRILREAAGLPFRPA